MAANELDLIDNKLSKNTKDNLHVGTKKGQETKEYSVYKVTTFDLVLCVFFAIFLGFLYTFLCFFL